MSLDIPDFCHQATFGSSGAIPPRSLTAGGCIPAVPSRNTSMNRKATRAGQYKDGWFWKTGGLNPAFKKRFYRLEDKTLSYAKTRDMEPVAGEIILTTETQMRSIAKLGNSKTGIDSLEGFTLKVTPNGRTYRFKFDNPRDKLELMNLITIASAPPAEGEEEDLALVALAEGAEEMFTAEMIDEAIKTERAEREAEEQKLMRQASLKAADERRQQKEAYKAKLTKGVEVTKFHHGKKGSAIRIVWINTASTCLFIAEKKTDKEESVKKQFPFSAIQNVDVVPDSNTMVNISTAEGEELKLAFENEKGRDNFVDCVVDCVFPAGRPVCVSMTC